MVRLSLKGNFIADMEDKGLLEHYFRGKYYKKGDSYILPGNIEVYRKIIMNFPENTIDPTCYLYPILETPNISRRTKKLYFQINKNFIEFVRKKPEDITDRDIQGYLDYLVKTKKRVSTVRTVYMGLRLFYEKLMGTVELSHIQIPKGESSIPDVLTRKEVKTLIDNIKNPKHQLIIKLAYGCGLKLSEVVNLQVKDIDLEKGFLKIRGKKKRIIPMSELLLKEIKNYLKNYYMVEGKNSAYVFFSPKNNKPISTRSVEIMFKKALLKTGLSTQYRFSILRDTFVVHMLEKDFCLDVISELTGMKEQQLINKYKFYINLVKKNRVPDLLDFSDVA